jgi:hypothetical protein
MTITTPGQKVLLMGPAGTGKTHSIGTLVESGIEVFLLTFESPDVLFGYWTDQGKEIPKNLHWHKMAAPKASFLELIDTATKINTMSFETLTKMSDPNRGKYNQFVQLLEVLNNFPDDRTGDKFGAVDTWDQTRALVIDGMSGINNAAMSLVVGGKPVKNMADWGIAQSVIMNLLRKLTEQCLCHLVILAHVERETDQIVGGNKISVSTLGKAIAGQIPSLFSDVILTVREGNAWTWDTANAQADVKTRSLPFAAKQSPDFRGIIEKWRSRVGAVNPG